MDRIVAASRNKHKLKEIGAILSKFDMNIVSRDDAGIEKFEVEEDGVTFEENSFKKADEIFKLCGEITISDDSGIMVDYLNGDPGVYSARFSGKNATDKENNDKLLKLLKDVEYKNRTAKFVSVITMIFPGDQILVARGECPGKILFEPVGLNGFGYDPLFKPDGYDKSYAQLTDKEKNIVSHRAKALNKLERLLSERKTSKKQI
ncbi:MAG: RdgB/HAM1 family non-canonical purine NTP pyrophosphatase [Clostridiales bacterium]|nr:RdgB/HAM1 family non-canonical purine NTP pyrophosphatase [Clostridiales bacterium]